MDLKNFSTAFAIRQRNLNLDFESTRSQQRWIQQFPAVGHSDDKGIWKLLDTV
jgi:hypothetical protein